MSRADRNPRRSRREGRQVISMWPRAAVVDPRRRHYRDNVVVTAVPAPRAGAATTLEPRHTDGTARNP